MGLLDVNVAQVATSSGSFADKAGVMRSTISQAESSAVQAQATHQGESSAAFQTAHSHFVEASTKINTLLDLASTQLGDAGTTYTTEDSAAAANISSSLGSLPSV